MATQQLTAAQLKAAHPEEFNRKYWAWVEYAHWEPCWDYTLEQWATEHGLHVDAEDISYSGFYSQGDGLAFDGRFEIMRIMDALELQTKAPALYLDVQEFGTNWVKVSRVNRWANCMSSGVDIDYVPGNCKPSGVFSGLPQADWDVLVENQWQQFADDIETHAVQLANRLTRELYEELRDDYEAVTSEEAYIEFCEAHEVTFEMENDEEIESCTCE